MPPARPWVPVPSLAGVLAGTLACATDEPTGPPRCTLNIEYAIRVRVIEAVSGVPLADSALPERGLLPTKGQHPQRRRVGIGRRARAERIRVDPVGAPPVTQVPAQVAALRTALRDRSAGPPAPARPRPRRRCRRAPAR